MLTELSILIRPDIEYPITGLIISLMALLISFFAYLKKSHKNLQKELEKINENYERIQLKRTENENPKHLEKEFNFGVKVSYEKEICHRILKGKLKINELCFAERTGNHTYYIYSFRYCRDCKAEEEYKQILELLQSDINHLPNGRIREALEQVYDNYNDYNAYLQCKMI